jgi:hypothetical protein
MNAVEFRANGAALARKTAHLSMTKTDYPEYAAVIAMGDAAVPLLILELEIKPWRLDIPVHHWMRALHELTGYWPATEPGKVQAAIDGWIKWWHESRLATPRGGE